jgi:hypothetical protein
MYRFGCVFIKRKARLPTINLPLAISGQGVADIIMALNVSTEP